MRVDVPTRGDLRRPPLRIGSPLSGYHEGGAHPRLQPGSSFRPPLFVLMAPKHEKCVERFRSDRQNGFPL